MGIDTVFLQISKSSDKWLSYIDGLKEPCDDLERSKYQYDCTKAFENKFHRFWRNMQSIILMPISFAGAVLYHCILKFRKKKTDCVILPAGKKYTNYSSLSSILPEEIKDEYNDKNVIENPRGRSLIFSGNMSFKILLILSNSIRRYPLSFLFHYRIFVQLCTINRYIIEFHPKAIVTIAGENDYTSSIVTYYCESLGVEYICVMHGEYFLTPYHAFVRFSRFYVWEDFYADQFVRTRSPVDMFRLYVPNRYKIKIDKGKETYFVAYYLQEFTEGQLQSIKNVLLELVRMGHKCKVRPHKRATDMQTFYKIFRNTEGIDIESYNVPIEESYRNCKYVVSIYSTVISEAYYSGLSVLIDDLSDPELYKTLENVMYINLNRISGRLSDLFKR